MSSARVVAVVLAGSLLSGCAALGNLLAEGVLPVVRGQSASFEEQADYDAAARKAPGDLALLESLVNLAPEHSGLNAAAAQSYGGYAFGFVEPIVGPLDSPDPAQLASAKAWYSKGREAGLKALRASQAFRAAEAGDIEAFANSLRSFGKADVPALFWTAYNWGQLINLSKDEPELVATLPRVTALMDRVKELDPSYYHGAAHAFDMVNAASRPRLLGGQPEVAREAYERARAVDGGKFLSHDVMFAQYYCVQIQDPALFKETLQRVLDTPADVLPAARLANVISKRRAKVLLDKIADFFPDLEEPEEPGEDGEAGASGEAGEDGSKAPPASSGEAR